MTRQRLRCAFEAMIPFVGLAAVGIVSRIGRALGARESPLVRLLIPVTREDRWNFVMLSAAAGVFEEFVFRGYLLHGLAEWTGMPWVAAAVTAVAFGVGHGYQRALGVVRASVLGFVLAVPVVLTGSLYPAVVAHFWINVTIGLGGWRWLVETDGPGGGDALALSGIPELEEEP
jgi:membrane protease YdiL (CAAX protease family)